MRRRRPASHLGTKRASLPTPCLLETTHSLQILDRRVICWRHCVPSQGNCWRWALFCLRLQEDSWLAGLVGRGAYAKPCVFCPSAKCFWTDLGMLWMAARLGHDHNASARPENPMPPRIRACAHCSLRIEALNVPPHHFYSTKKQDVLLAKGNACWVRGRRERRQATVFPPPRPPPPPGTTCGRITTGE